MKGTSDVERGWAGETSTIWYTRRRCASLWPCSSLYAKSYPTLNNVCVCWVRVKRKRSAHCQSWAGDEWGCIHCSLQYLQKFCTLWKESIFLIWANLVIVNLLNVSVSLQEKSPRGWTSWLVDSTQQLCLQGMSVKGRKRHGSLYIHPQLLPDLTYCASKVHCVILYQFLDKQCFLINYRAGALYILTST